MVAILNETRSYVCGGIKKVVRKFYDEHNRMPDMTVIVSILQREDLVENDEGTSWMVPPEWIWWWSSVLSKAAADKTAWPESARNFNLIGAHKDTNGACLNVHLSTV